MAKMPGYENFLHDIAMKALEYEFEGKTIREWIDILKDYQSSKWICVEERLPEDNVNVLVYAIGNNEDSIIAMTSYTHRMYGYNISGWRSVAIFLLRIQDNSLDAPARTAEGV